MSCPAPAARTVCTSGTAVGVGALVLAPAGWAIQHAVLTVDPTPPAPPAYQPGDQVWTDDRSDRSTRRRRRSHCDTVADAENFLAQLELAACSPAQTSDGPLK